MCSQRFNPFMITLTPSENSKIVPVVKQDVQKAAEIAFGIPPEKLCFKLLISDPSPSLRKGHFMLSTEGDNYFVILNYYVFAI